MEKSQNSKNYTIHYNIQKLYVISTQLVDSIQVFLRADVRIKVFV